ncbi:hypothetical protein MLD38_027715 [Melastoma candidum]|uniref:Uncharacterized protein n=1 Tax=Melastoma candidum TaxID=119954 RepID=A0ACB9P2M5_9MYRT|nr:hypothetical protein MLD38_027715 [Melastoma candidum]
MTAESQSQSQSQSLLPPSPNPAEAAVSAPVPPAQRRPRVREVRSRFMSPVVPSSASLSKSPLPDSRCRTQPPCTSSQRRRQLDLDPPPENRPHVSRSLETPFLAAHRRRGGNPLKENVGADSSRLARPDTPVVSSSMDRIVPSRYRQTPSQRSVGMGMTPATKLLHSNGMSFSGPSAPSSDTASQNDPDENSVCGSESDLGRPGELGLAKLITDVRCSIPEGDMLPSVSNSLLTERNGNCETVPKVPKSPHWRLPSSPFLSGSLERPVSGLAKQTITTTAGKVCLPPVPPGGKTLIDVKKGKKAVSHQEDVHMLKLLHNHYLQWRFANAKAEASTQSLKEEAERMLFSVCAKIGDMHTSVKRKHAELELLRRAANLSAIVESQMPYLEDWSAIEGDYLASISETIQALSNVALQLPISGIAKADVKEIKDTLFITARVMDAVASHVEKFTTKAQQLEVYLSELAKATSGEKVVMEECRGLLSEAYASQVRECSLRSQIIQSRRHQSLLIQ